MAVLLDCYKNSKGNEKMLISLVEYGQRHGKTRGTVREMAVRGGFKTAQKIGRNWIIDSDEPYPDNRVKTGKYVNWRKPKNKTSSSEPDV